MAKMVVPDHVVSRDTLATDGLERLADMAVAWQGHDPTLIAGSVLDALRDMLHLDCVGLRFHDTTHIFLRLGTSLAEQVDEDAIRYTIGQWLDAGDREGVPTGSMQIGGSEQSVACVPLGAVASIGVIVAVAARQPFPNTAERAVLTLAAKLAALACREIRTHSERSAPLDTRIEKPIGDALAESEHRLHLIINTIPAVAWSAAPDGMLDFVNQYFLDYIGGEFADVSGLKYDSIFHPDDRDRLLSSWQETMASKRGREVEGRIRRADGEYRWFNFRQNPLLDAKGNVVKWYGVISDIEDRKRAEDALKASEAALSASERRLHQIISSIPGLAWSADPQGGTTFWSDQYLDYAGLSMQDVLGTGFHQHLHPDDKERILAFTAKTVRSGQPGDVVARLRRSDGQYRWFLIRASPFHDATGRLTQWFGVNIDIDDRMRVETQLRQSQAELTRVTRALTIGELAVSIAHEINQPLMAIVTNAGTCLRWLQAEQLDVPKARTAAERVVRDGHRAGDIITTLRAMVDKAPPRMERVDLGRAIEEVLELTRPELQRRGVTLLLDGPGTPLMIHGDRTQVQQVVLNLVMNGAEAMNEIGLASRKLAIRWAANAGGQAEIRVSDAGSGIAVGMEERVFDALFSTKPGGIGMGLSICRSIVEAHGGQISTANGEARGCVVTFTLPLINAEAPTCQ